MDPATKTATWQGYESLDSLVIFGDSYSSISHQAIQQRPLKPTPKEPLGLPFPGVTYAGDGKANWVGHLISRYSKSSPLVYDYAVGGCTAEHLADQVRQYIEGPGRSTSSRNPLNYLFIIWIGFNDVSKPEQDLKLSHTSFFAAVAQLLDAGANNFLFINVAPLPKSAQSDLFNSREQRCHEWNAWLAQQAQQLADSDVTVFIFDAHRVFSQMIENPTAYGFSSDAGWMRDGEMYIDNIHPTTAVHNVVAKEIASFLLGTDIGEAQEDKYSSIENNPPSVPRPTIWGKLKGLVKKPHV